MFYFTPLTGVLFTFPSRYLFTIGRQSVFSLTGWSRQIHTEFLVFRATWDTAEVQTISLTGLSPSLVCLPRHLQLSLSHLVCCPATPTVLAYNWFGLFPFHSPLLRESLFCFIFPLGTKMFQFPSLPPHNLCIQLRGYQTLLWQGCPIRRPRDRSL